MIKKETIFGIIIIVLLIITAVVILKPKVEQESKKEIYEYFVFTQGENHGVINKKGEMVIDSKYDEIYIPDNQKDVFMCVDSNNKTVFLNSKSELLYKDFENVNILVKSNTEFETEDVLKYQKDGKFGIINFDGDIITENIYDDIESLTYKPGCLLVKKDGKYGVISLKGKTIIEPIYDVIVGDGYVSEDGKYDETGFIVTTKTENGNLLGYLNKKGKVILENKYETISRVSSEKNKKPFLIVMENGKKGVFKNKKELIEINYQEIFFDDKSEIFIVNKNGKYGFCTLTGKEIIEPKYTEYSIAGNYISVKNNDIIEVYDTVGNYMENIKYTGIQSTSNPEYYIAMDEDGYYSIINKDLIVDNKYTDLAYAFDDYFIFTNEEGLSGVLSTQSGIVIKPTYDYVLVAGDNNMIEAGRMDDNVTDIYSRTMTKVVSVENAEIETLEENFTVIYAEGTIKYFNEDGIEVKNSQIFEKELYTAFKETKWGFKNKKGDLIVDYKYDMVTELNEYGFAGIKKDGKWGVIDSSGKVIVEPTYDLGNTYNPSFVGKYFIEVTDTVHCISFEESN